MEPDQAELNNIHLSVELWGLGGGGEGWNVCLGFCKSQPGYGEWSNTISSVLCAEGEEVFVAPIGQSSEFHVCM